jgi:type III pantothenate kinase
MLIGIDIGNTNIKAGKIVNNNLDEIFLFDKTNDVLNFIKSNKADDIAISSVVPSKTKSISEEIIKLSGKSPFIITKDTKTNLTMSYKTPDTLGIDRLCSAEGAFFLFKNSCIEQNKSYKYILSIDFGTATTINVVEYPGKFIGGLIAPGIKMMFESLNKKTAQLPDVDISDFNSIIGNDTYSSIAGGVVASVVGMIEKIINYLNTGRGIQSNAPTELFIYLTGGNAKIIIPFLNFDFIYEEGLVLYGINALFELNKTVENYNSE